jgi:hypothetical protein
MGWRDIVKDLTPFAAKPSATKHAQFISRHFVSKIIISDVICLHYIVRVFRSIGKTWKLVKPIDVGLDSLIDNLVGPEVITMWNTDTTSTEKIARSNKILCHLAAIGA